MNKSDIHEYLKANQDARGIAYWNEHRDKSGGLKSYGFGLTKLRKYSKTIGRDPKLARQLWNSNVYEMKIISLLIDEGVLPDGAQLPSSRELARALDEPRPVA